MLRAMRDAVPAAAHIETLVNTHGNGDHCFGNQLVAGARIIASEQAAEVMAELPPAAMAALIEQAPKMGQLGEFFLACFGRFDFSGIELTLPEQTFNGELTLHVGSRRLELIEVGPAHTRGDTLIHAPAERVLFSGDILFSAAHPIAWAGPVSNWIAACERILAMDIDVIVPGHGPLAEPAAVRELQAYFEYLYARGARPPRRGHERAAGGALAVARPLGRLGRVRAPRRQRREHLPRALRRDRAAEPAERVRTDGRARGHALSGFSRKLRDRRARALEMRADHV